MKKNFKINDFDYYLQQELKDPEFKKLYDYYGKQLEISYAILQLRKKHNMTQEQLAKKVGTSQSNIARMERGQQNFTIETLDKIAKTFGKKLTVDFQN